MSAQCRFAGRPLSLPYPSQWHSIRSNGNSTPFSLGLLAWGVGFSADSRSHTNDGDIICRLFSSKYPSTRAEPFERHTILPLDPTRLETSGAHAKADTLWTLQLDALEDVSVPERLISEARLQSMLAERAPHFVPLARVPAHAPMSASSPHPPADPTNGESPGSGVGRDLDAWLLPGPCPFTCIWNASCPYPAPERSPSAIIAPCQLLAAAPCQVSMDSPLQWQVGCSCFSHLHCSETKGLLNRHGAAPPVQWGPPELHRDRLRAWICSDAHQCSGRSLRGATGSWPCRRRCVNFVSVWF